MDAEESCTPMIDSPTSEIFSALDLETQAPLIRKSAVSGVERPSLAASSPHKRPYKPSVPSSPRSVAANGEGSGRVPWSPEETENLTLGFKQFGKQWAQILNAYKFHPKRTNVSLKDRARQIGLNDLSDHLAKTPRC
jgi:hypothetical protein